LEKKKLWLFISQQKVNSKWIIGDICDIGAEKKFSVIRAGNFLGKIINDVILINWTSLKFKTSDVKKTPIRKWKGNQYIRKK
jgi:hypothetical protein